VGLKVDSSFLRFVTMGALGARRVCGLMARAGLDPIELERYSRSNKIWTTKVKRLRLPDLLCIKTGLRVEVRAKSKLAIKMSDTPTKPDRRWNSGLGSGDMIAFVLIREAEDGTLNAADNAELFWVEDLLATEHLSRLGPPKSASEGAERDREWPSTVATSDGVVLTLNDDRLMALLRNGRTQSYRLQGKTAYRRLIQPFLGESQFLAGVPRRQATFPAPQTTAWDPRPLLRSDSAVDRYVAVKALGRIGTGKDNAALTHTAQSDLDGRVALEAAAALTRLGDEHGLEFLSAAIKSPKIDFLRMEAILALAELEGTALAKQCAQVLAACAREPALAGDEARQAAIWALGKDGLREYGILLDFLSVDRDEELVHAVCAFASDADQRCADALVSVLTSASSSPRHRASASHVLARCLAPAVAVPRWVRLTRSADKQARNWGLATLGQISPAAARPLIEDQKLAMDLEPLQLTSPETNWTRSEALAQMLTFVSAQTITDGPGE
jgi:HEAT repeat protein